MTPKVPSYERRCARIRKPGDEQRELLCAKRYVQRLRRQALKAPSLQEKLQILEAVKEAEGVLRKMRLSIYDLEDLAHQRAQAQEVA